MAKVTQGRERLMADMGFILGTVGNDPKFQDWYKLVNMVETTESTWRPISWYVNRGSYLINQPIKG